ncbi:MAG: type II toxin-antitoxin system RelE/ParE family toxin [Methanobacteriota archaeon]|nr:MAG: type II toxin-antitoxin system RelE/ParE family toxin [Euryarchaeota archaeon]
MVWSVELTDRALRDFDKLDRQVARRIVARLERAAANPERFFSRVVGSDEYKLRIGDYRLLAALSHGTKMIIVARVDHRSRVYDRG